MFYKRFVNCRVNSQYGMGVCKTIYQCYVFQHEKREALKTWRQFASRLPETD